MTESRLKMYDEIYFTNGMDHVKLTPNREKNSLSLSIQNEGKAEHQIIELYLDDVDFTITNEENSMSVPMSESFTDATSADIEEWLIDYALAWIRTFAASALTPVPDPTMEDPNELTVVFCPKCEDRIEIPASIDLTKIAIDCPTCNRIIECDEW